LQKAKGWSSLKRSTTGTSCASNNLHMIPTTGYRFHPAIQRVKAILESDELGAIKSISASILITSGIMGAGDIRWNYDLGGGAMMDGGCKQHFWYIGLRKVINFKLPLPGYLVNCIRYLSGSDPTSVVSVSPTLYPESRNAPANFAKIDTRTVATLALPANVIGNLTVDLALAPTMGFIPKIPSFTLVVECEGGDVELWPFIMPTVYHSITVKTRQGGQKGSNVRVEKQYTFDDGGKGEAWWTTYVPNLLVIYLVNFSLTLFINVGTAFSLMSLSKESRERHPKAG
jgi:hypothetical protein